MVASSRDATALVVVATSADATARYAEDQKDEANDEDDEPDLPENVACNNEANQGVRCVGQPVGLHLQQLEISTVPPPHPAARHTPPRDLT